MRVVIFRLSFYMLSQWLGDRPSILILAFRSSLIVCIVCCKSIEISGNIYQINSENDIFCRETVCRFANEVAMTRRLGIKDPLVSCMAYPSFPDVFPPLLITTGEKEMLRDQIVQFAYRLRESGNLYVRLEVWQDMLHIFQGSWFFHPSAEEGMSRIAEFCKA